MIGRAFQVALALALVTAGAAQARPGQALIFDAPRELTSTDAAVRARALDEISRLGAGRVRLVVPWQRVAPAPDARSKPVGFVEQDSAGYRWGVYDAVLREAAARGLRPIVVLSGPVPRWATARRSDHVTDPSATRFARFAEAAGHQWGDLVDTWSIWNEPNHPQFLGPQFRRGRPASPRIYRRLFQAGERGLRAAGQERDRLLAGETAPRGTPRVVAPIEFVREALCLDARWRLRRGCARLRVEGWAHHPYTTRSGPWFVPPDRTDVTIGVLARLRRALDRAAQAGAVRKRLSIWLTEFGVQSEPDPFIGVSEQSQAEFRAIAERTAWNDRRVAAFSQYLLHDDLPRNGSARDRFGGFESGLRHSSGAPKRAYEHFPLPIAAVRNGSSARTHLWGLVRRVEVARSVTIEYRDRPSSRWLTLKHDRTDRYGRWQTTTRYAAGRRYRVRVAGERAPAASGVRARTR